MGSSLHRIVAYIFDMTIIMIITTMLTFWIPVSDNYKNIMEEKKEQQNLLQDGEITYNQYFDNSLKLSYRADKERIIDSIVVIVVTIGYFATFAYYKGGQTIGKRIVKTKIVMNDMADVNHNTMFIRAILFNGVGVSLISIILLLFISEGQYYFIYLLSFIHSLFVLISLFMVLFRKDKRVLHDIICGTKVISLESRNISNFS